MTVTPSPAPLPSEHSAFNGPFPAKLKRFNWGALFFNWIWAFNHKRTKEALTYIGIWVFSLALQMSNDYSLMNLSALVTLVLFGYSIYLGVRGNEMAWQSRSFESVEQFTEVQKRWTLWALGLLLIPIFLIYSIVISLATSF